MEFVNIAKEVKEAKEVKVSSPAVTSRSAGVPRSAGKKKCSYVCKGKSCKLFCPVGSVGSFCKRHSFEKCGVVESKGKYKGQPCNKRVCKDGLCSNHVKWEEPTCYLFRYTNEMSAELSSQRDAEIGWNYNLVGSNKHSRLINDCPIWVIYDDSTGQKMISFVGYGCGKDDNQVWSASGGMKWNYIFRVYKGTNVGIPLETFASRYDIKSGDILSGSRIGYVKKNNRTSFIRSINEGFWTN